MLKKYVRTTKLYQVQSALPMATLESGRTLHFASNYG